MVAHDLALDGPGGAVYLPAADPLKGSARFSTPGRFPASGLDRVGVLVDGLLGLGLVAEHPAEQPFEALVGLLHRRARGVTGRFHRPRRRAVTIIEIGSTPDPLSIRRPVQVYRWRDSDLA
ncbi:MAG: hypothetical protein ACRD2W_10945 [Acidimicrobiales bacterium]